MCGIDSVISTDSRGAATNHVKSPNRHQACDSQNVYWTESLGFVTKKVQKCTWGYKTSLELLGRSQTVLIVTRHNNCNDTMLQRSAQLLLAAENELFEGGMKKRTGIRIWKIPEFSDLEL